MVKFLAVEPVMTISVGRFDRSTSPVFASTTWYSQRAVA